jgi:ubiquinol-cytochrome c reductase iron-sulfur subunit
MTATPGPGGPRDQGHLRVLSESIPPESQINDTIVIFTSVLAAVGGLGFGLGLLLGLPLWLYGTFLAVALLSLGLAVRRFFLDRYADVEAMEPREHPIADEDASAPISEVRSIPRRGFLGRVLGGAAALLGIGLAAPVVSLGPAPGDELRRTAWERGRRVVTTDGEPVRPGDIAVGGVLTVWPEGAVNVEIAAVMLLRLSGGPPEPPTNADWVVDEGLVGYSKICTHAGCPVGLFRERDDALFCPCHQSTFDARRGAEPTFGPAARALPQLPMAVDGEGYLTALDDFTEQVGPAFG